MEGKCKILNYSSHIILKLIKSFKYRNIFKFQIIEEILVNIHITLRFGSVFNMILTSKKEIKQEILLDFHQIKFYICREK